jgi:hypothetical protein
MTGVAACALLVACGTDDAAKEAAGTGVLEQGEEVGLPPHGGTNDACPGVRWVGRAPLQQGGGVACPAPSGADWSGSALFGSGAPAPLNRFCAYEWTGEGAPPAGRPPLTGGDPGDWLEADCRVAAAQSPSVDVVWPDLLDAWQRQIDAVDPLPGASALLARVRIAVADSATNIYDLGRPSYGLYDHGRTVGLTARHLACPTGGGPCVGDVSSHLALPRTDDGHAHPALGGFYGYQSEVALAVYHAIDDWQAFNATAAPADRQDRLVLNLSLGWAPPFGGPIATSPESDLRPAVLAVYQAITWARCNGALVVAAAGNSGFGPSPAGGPLFPAGWERRGAPTAAECNTYGGVVVQQGRPAFSPGDEVYDPLVTAAAGLDDTDAPLFNSRPGSATRLAAPAYFVVAEDFDPDNTGVPGPPQPTPAFTGSSMAAAGLSGAVAAVWAHAPELTPAQVVDLVYRNAVVLGGYPADVCLGGGPCGDVHRVSVCRALAAACASHAGLCSTAPTCDTVAAFAGSDAVAPLTTDADGDGTPDLDETLTAGPFDATGLLTSTTVGCGAAPLAYDAPLPAYPCPQEALPAAGATPWVGPQPDDDPCDVCLLSGANLYITVSSALDPTRYLINPILTRYDGYAKAIDSISLGTINPAVSPLHPGDYVKVLGLPTASRTVKTATVSFTSTGSDGKTYTLVGPAAVH